MESDNVWVAMKEWAKAKFPVLPCCSPHHQDSSKKHIERCSSPGKVPLIQWKNCGVPEDDLIDHWSNRWPNANIGLLLGQASQLAGIDVDGAGGKQFLDEFSRGDLPKTWTFVTPSGGLRYLYKIPAGLVTKKYVKSDPMCEHSEMAILVDGSFTVMPPSLGVNGNKYEWLCGCSPDDLDAANAPRWIMALITKAEGGEFIIQPTDVTQNTADAVIDHLSEKCPRFHEALAEQRKGGNAEDLWYTLLRLFVRKGQAEAALAYSKLSVKHNFRSQTRINELVAEGPGGTPRCSTIGCDDVQIKTCFGNRVKVDDKGKIRNSPGRFLRQMQPGEITSLKRENDPQADGLILNEEGKITSCNGNIFSRTILRSFDLIFTVGARFYHYCDGVYRFIDDNPLSRLLRNFLHTYQSDIWTNSFETKYLEALKREAPFVARLDGNRLLINCRNGMLDIETFKLLEHDPKYRSTIQIPFNYDSKAKCPRFLQFIAEIFMGDTELAAIIQEFFGYCLTTETKAEKFVVLSGTGGNGKSKLMECLIRIVGKQNVSSVSLRDLNNSFVRLDLVDKTLNIATEAETDGKGLDTELLKAIVSGDEIRVERKFGESFSYKPVCKMAYAMNRLPYSRDRSHGFTRRLIIVPFNRTFEDEEADRDLSEKLVSESEGIFLWALEGLKRLRANGYNFTKSTVANSTLEEYKTSLNPMLEFVRECVVQASPTVRVENKTLMERFRRWCLDNGHSKISEMTARRFSDEIKEILKREKISFTIGKSGGRYIGGIQLKLTTSDDDNEIEILDMD